MAKSKEKNKALKLRQRGESINDIAKKLKVSKSTVSLWCRNISLNPKQIKRLVEKQKIGSYSGRLKFLEKIRDKRIKEVAKLKKEGLKEVGKVNKRDIFIAGIAMYVSEGATSPSKEEVSFYNSDPKIILFILKWFKKICKISDDRFAIQIRINEIHKKRIKKVENYWSELTGIPLSQFTKTILIKVKNKKIYPNHNTYYGTVRVMVHRGVQLRRKINGWIEGLLKAPV